MSTTAQTPSEVQTEPAAVAAVRRLGARPARRTGPASERPNYVAGVLSIAWLIIIAVPIYMMVKYSLQSQQDYLNGNPLAPPTHPSLGNYAYVLQHGFVLYGLNTAIVMIGSVGLVLIFAVPAAYAIVRSPSRFISWTFRLFLFGLAIPAQATIIPVYLLITKLGLYDSLIAIILPGAAFGLPLSILVLVGSLRDIPQETYEAMSLDGASAAKVFWHLVLPFGKSAIMTVAIFSALGAWNSFIFPLLLTQSPGKRVLTLSLYQFQGEFQTNVPGLMAAVVLSAVPIFLLYLFGRRWLMAGLIGMGGK
ncbi:carbohydrate ABC transporter permease [Microlunatus sp. Gsoil 973]|uniref:carbohydrate ABC transporter permease n=1 Tax=Microlunatus sp. Gsoil 973 TaxID=2672569 RepID=UPI0012B480ED|nr:carbohydrate ABC transporter permease [Microlunatus sp. Gsoil 973]QGN31595.1 ABC transporter permease subunit [Microlunatus sp. Gsoil 973]